MANKAKLGGEQKLGKTSDRHCKITNDPEMTNDCVDVPQMQFLSQEAAFFFSGEYLLIPDGVVIRRDKT